MYGARTLRTVISTPALLAVALAILTNALAVSRTHILAQGL